MRTGLSGRLRFGTVRAQRRGHSGRRWSRRPAQSAGDTTRVGYGRTAVLLSDGGAGERGTTRWVAVWAREGCAERREVGRCVRFEEGRARRLVRPNKLDIEVHARLSVLKAFRMWQKMAEPAWPNFDYGPIDYQDLHYYSAPKQKKESPTSLEEVDEELLKTFDRLGIPLTEQKRLTGVAVDAVFDSISVGTTHQSELAKHGARGGHD